MLLIDEFSERANVDECEETWKCSSIQLLQIPLTGGVETFVLISTKASDFQAFISVL